MRNTGRSFLILACVLLWSGMVRAEIVDRTVAVVNGDIILYSELQENVGTLKTVSPELKSLDPSQDAQLEREVLQRMIHDRLTEQEMKRLKITVNEREVDATVARIKEENGLTDDQLGHALLQEGKTLAQFREGVRKELERSRLIERVFKSKIVISEEQVTAHLKSGGSDVKEQRRLAVIFLPVQEGRGEKQLQEIEKLARDIHARLKKGADFASLAREYSRGPASHEGGDLGFIASDELMPAIEMATRGLGSNVLAEPVKTPGGCFVVKVIDVRREKQTGDESMGRERVRRQVLLEEINRRFEKWVRELESRSFIQIYL